MFFFLAMSIFGELTSVINISKNRKKIYHSKQTLKIYFFSPSIRYNSELAKRLSLS